MIREGDGVEEALAVCLRLARVNALMVRRFDGVLGALHGVGLSDFMVLAALDAAPEGQLRRVDLADRLGLTASAVTRIIGPLERIGLVARVADPGDARVGLARLTGTGRERYRQARVAAEGVAAELAPQLRKATGLPAAAR
jgi:DNA-binding MarR family transcriptional regulator